MYSSHDIDTESVDCAEAANPMKRKKSIESKQILKEKKSKERDLVWFFSSSFVLWGLM